MARTWDLVKTTYTILFLCYFSISINRRLDLVNFVDMVILQSLINLRLYVLLMALQHLALFFNLQVIVQPLYFTTIYF